MNYEPHLIQSTYINFLPFIGPNYSTSNIKILILGHSHYANCDGTPEQMEQWDNCKDTTRNVIGEDYLATLLDKGKSYRWTKCYRRMAAVIAGEGYYHSDYIWNQLAFHNFFQKHVGVSPSDRQFRTQELSEFSWKALCDVIKILWPDVIICWGNELWFQELPEDNCRPGNIVERSCYYDEFPHTLFWGMKHPSARNFNIDTERNTWKSIEHFILQSMKDKSNTI